MGGDSFFVHESCENKKRVYNETKDIPYFL